MLYFQVFRLGPIEFTPQQVYVGVISGLIAFPANLIIVSFFRYAKERPKKKNVVSSKYPHARLLSRCLQKGGGGNPVATLKFVCGYLRKG